MTSLGCCFFSSSFSMLGGSMTLWEASETWDLMTQPLRFALTEGKWMNPATGDSTTVFLLKAAGACLSPNNPAGVFSFQCENHKEDPSTHENCNTFLCFQNSQNQLSLSMALSVIMLIVTYKWSNKQKLPWSLCIYVNHPPLFYCIVSSVKKWLCPDPLDVSVNCY